MISVCIATHNGEKYIKKQLESILSQLDFSDEIVISDDGSTDQTINLIQSLEDKRIKIFTYKQCFDYSKLYLSSYYYATANFHNALHKEKSFFWQIKMIFGWKTGFLFL